VLYEVICSSHICKAVLLRCVQCILLYVEMNNLRKQLSLSSVSSLVKQLSEAFGEDALSKA